MRNAVLEQNTWWGGSKRPLGFFLEVFGRFLVIAAAISVVVLVVRGVPGALIGLVICILGLKIQLRGRRYTRGRYIPAVIP